PCPACVQTDTLDAPQNLRRILRLNEPNLKISARGNLDVARRKLVRHARNFPKLKRFELPARNSQPRHERFFLRREIKQPIPFEASVCSQRWREPFARLRQHQ